MPKYKYKVTLKGSLISRHFTKRNADKKAKSIRGARVVSIGGGYKKRKTKKYYR